MNLEHKAWCSRAATARAQLLLPGCVQFLVASNQMTSTMMLPKVNELVCRHLDTSRVTIDDDNVTAALVHVAIAGMSQFSIGEPGSVIQQLTLWYTRV